MTWQFDINNLNLAASDHGICWTKLKDLGVLHGALVVMGTGDGIAAFENTGDTAGPFDVLTGGTSVWNSLVANEFSNTAAWMRLRETGSTREWVIFRHTSTSASFEGDYIVVFSPTGFDDTGVATANLPPTASAGDEVFMIGGPLMTNYEQWGPTYNNDARIHVAIEDAAAGGVYSWYILGRATTTGTPNGIFVYEGLSDGPAADPQPWMVHCPDSANSGFPWTNSDDELGTYHDFGGGGEVWLAPQTPSGASPYGLVDSSGGRIIPGLIPPQVDGDARTFPIIIGRDAISSYRGICRNLKWKGTNARGYPDTRDLATANAMLYVDDVLFPWETGTVPLT